MEDSLLQLDIQEEVIFKIDLREVHSLKNMMNLMMVELERRFNEVLSPENRPPNERSIPAPPAPPKKDVDLFDFDDDNDATTASNGKGKGIDLSGGDDDFDDFQSATETNTKSATTAKPPISLPSLFNAPPPAQSNPVRPIIPTTSSTSSFPPFAGISSPPPLQQSTRPPNLQSSFGTGKTPSPAPTAGITMTSPAGKLPAKLLFSTLHHRILSSLGEFNM